MIQIRQLRHSFDKKAVLRNITHDFEPGAIHGIIGLNGAGKTTFFEILSEFLKPTAGRIMYEEEQLGRAQVGFLETANYFYPNLSGKEYLDIFPQTNERFQLSLFNELLKLDVHELIENYSTGMKKKLALLAILKQDKPIYILDEPFNGLDLETNAILEQIIRKLKTRGKTLFIAAHILPPLLSLCDHIHWLKDGVFAATYQRAQFPEIQNSLLLEVQENAESMINRAF